MRVKPLTGMIGALVTGIDLSRKADKHMLAELRSVWLEYLVIFVRGQKIAPSQQIAIAEQIGEPDVYPFLNGLPDYPQITEVLKKADETVNFGGVWHTDTCYQLCPPMATMLYAKEIPACGGDTIFASQYAAFDSISTGLADTLKGLFAVSKAGNKAVAATRVPRIEEQGTGKPSDDLQALHPAVRKHSETGKPSLYLSPAHTTQFAGWSEQESAALLAVLFERQTQHEICCRHQWQPGDLALWDNRCTLHFPVNDYHGHRRLMHRITLKGDAPKAYDE